MITPQLNIMNIQPARRIPNPPKLPCLSYSLEFGTFSLDPFSPLGEKVRMRGFNGSFTPHPNPLPKGERGNVPKSSYLSSRFWSSGPVFP